MKLVDSLEVIHMVVKMGTLVRYLMDLESKMRIPTGAPTQPSIALVLKKSVVLMAFSAAARCVR